jgi:preprotein translocase subunit SecE
VARSSSARAPRAISRETLRRGSPVQFFQETIAELRKAAWPTREETARLTWIVILLSAAVGFLLAGLDYVLNQTFTEYVLHR